TATGAVTSATATGAVAVAVAVVPVAVVPVVPVVAPIVVVRSVGPVAGVRVIRWAGRRRGRVRHGLARRPDRGVAVVLALAHEIRELAQRHLVERVLLRGAAAERDQRRAGQEASGPSVHLRPPSRRSRVLVDAPEPDRPCRMPPARQ